MFISLRMRKCDSISFIPSSFSIENNFPDSFPTTPHAPILRLTKSTFFSLDKLLIMSVYFDCFLSSFLRMFVSNPTVNSTIYMLVFVVITRSGRKSSVVMIVGDRNPVHITIDPTFALLNNG